MKKIAFMLFILGVVSIDFVKASYDDAKNKLCLCMVDAGITGVDNFDVASQLLETHNTDLEMVYSNPSSLKNKEKKEKEGKKKKDDKSSKTKDKKKQKDGKEDKDAAKEEKKNKDDEPEQGDENSEGEKKEKSKNKESKNDKETKNEETNGETKKEEKTSKDDKKKKDKKKNDDKPKKDKNKGDKLVKSLSKRICNDYIPQSDEFIKVCIEKMMSCSEQFLKQAASATEVEGKKEAQIIEEVKIKEED